MKVSRLPTTKVNRKTNLGNNNYRSPRKTFSKIRRQDAYPTVYVDLLRLTLHAYHDIKERDLVNNDDVRLDWTKKLDGELTDLYKRALPETFSKLTNGKMIFRSRICQKWCHPGASNSLDGYHDEYAHFYGTWFNVRGENYAGGHGEPWEESFNILEQLMAYERGYMDDRH